MHASIVFFSNFNILNLCWHLYVNTSFCIKYTCVYKLLYFVFFELNLMFPVGNIKLKIDFNIKFPPDAGIKNLR